MWCRLKVSLAFWFGSLRCWERSARCIGSRTKLSVSFQIPEPVTTEIFQHCEYFRLVWKRWCITQKNKQRAGSLQYCIFCGNYGFCYMGRFITGPPSSNSVHFVGSVWKKFLGLTCREFNCLCSLWWGCLSPQTVHRWHKSNRYFTLQILSLKMWV